MPTVGRARILRKQKKSDLFDTFPVEVRALRARAKHAQTCLIVVIDGDELSDAQIRGRLRQKLQGEGLDDAFDKDPILVLCPRWEMENWVLHLLGDSIGEARADNARQRVGDRGREAGRMLADACRVGKLPIDPLPSIENACKEWAAHRKQWNY